MADNNFMWHKVSDEEKEEIRQQTKDLLNEFSKKISSVGGNESHFISSINETGLREEGQPWNFEQDFRDLFFLNAPFVEDDFIVSERGEWKK